MLAPLRAVTAALVSLTLAGCAITPFRQAMTRDVATAVHPLEVKIGIAQVELTPTYKVANSGGSACGSAPGIGLLLAVACASTVAAVDAGINAKRAREAQEIFAPLKAHAADLAFDTMMRDALASALSAAPGVKHAGVTTTRTVTDEHYDAWFRASTANAVMVSNVTYHLTADFSALVVSARNMVYPRSPAARSAAGQPAGLPTEASERALAYKNAVYRRNFFYVARLPQEADEREAHVAAWKADGARLLRAAIQDAVAQLSRLATEDLQQLQGTDPVALSQMKGHRGTKADVLMESHGGRLLRYPNGDLEFATTVAAKP